MHPVEALRRLGGVGDRSALLNLTTRRRLRTALGRGEVVRTGRGRYALPTAPAGLRAAGALAGVASHTSAAAIHGWELARAPERPHVTVPRGRKVSGARRAGVQLWWRPALDEDQVVRGVVTEPHRTVIDCARDLPFPDALAVADSALRRGQVDPDRLEAMALRLTTAGRRAALRVVTSADPRAANPFESVLRAIALDVPGLDLEPQGLIDERGFRVRPDLVDRKRRLVLEADSFQWHGSRRALSRDCERYNALVVLGWRVLRFSWEQVMLEPDYTRECLIALVEGPSRRTALPSTLPPAA